MLLFLLLLLCFFLEQKISAFALVLDFLEMVDEVEEDVAWMDDRASLAFGRFPQMVLL